MKYLFLDDERFPKDVTWLLIGGVGHWGADWQIVRSFQEAKEWVLKNGFPDVISFDHDLGLMHYAGDYSDEKTGYDFAKWLIEYDMDTHTMPEDFKYTIHSKNPTGSENIRSLLFNYQKFQKSDKY
ncbi:MAG TPA: cyclic-phosphate processing receiver domain-containing protein [Ignavibacteriaceae bacterium]